MSGKGTQGLAGKAEQLSLILSNEDELNVGPSLALGEVLPVFEPQFPIQWEKSWYLCHRVVAKTK